MYSIQAHNTFRLDHKVSKIYNCNSVALLKKALLVADNAIIIGGGSNVLFTRNTERPVILIDIKGIQIISEDDKSVSIKVGAGEDWHDLVLWTIDQDYGGLENLSLIPGKCGAAPMQNIGAYGVELSDVLVSVQCVERSSGIEVELQAVDCQLGYRQSLFKDVWRDKYVITSISLKLSKTPHHRINIAYGDIRQILGLWEIKYPTLRNISDAVIQIRRSKLPDPDQLPNAGSFFKNPIISLEEFHELKARFPAIPSYKVSGQFCKVPAGWLIDECGWKGVMIDDVGVHSRQALVIVNHGSKDGEKIMVLARLIQDSVFKKYKIALIPEVNILP